MINNGGVFFVFTAPVLWPMVSGYFMGMQAEF